MSSLARKYPLIPGLDLPQTPKEPPEEQPVNPAREFKPKRSNDLALYICHQQEAEQIFQRKSDGYFDATAMCNAYKKQFSDWSRLESTNAWLNALASERGIPRSLLIQTNRSGPYSTRGTWVHPEVAVELARWLEPLFGVRVNHWWLEWMKGRPPKFNRDDIEPFVLGRLLKACDAIERIDERGARIENGALQRIERYTQQTMFEHWRRNAAEPTEIEIAVTKAGEPEPPKPDPGNPRTWIPRKPGGQANGR